MRKILLFIFFLIALYYSKAQTVQLKFDHFTEKEGLPDPQIQFISQDDQGYIWMGTVLGLVRYDGYKLKICHFGDRNSVTGMISDANNNLWFSTHLAGLFRYDRSHDSFIPYPYPQTQDETNLTYVTLKFADGKGNLWGYGGNNQHHEIIKFYPKGKNFEYFGNGQKGAHNLNYTSNILQSKSSGHPIWTGAKNGLYLYDEKDDTFLPYFSVTDTARQKTVYRIAEAPSEPGILWLNVFDHLSKKQLIERFDTRNKTFKDFSHLTNPVLTASNDTLNDLYEDSRHRLWFGTQNGLMLFNRVAQTFTAFIPADTDKEAYKNQVYHIIAVKNGVLWFSSGKGLMSFDTEKQHFERFTANRKDPDALSWNVLNNLFFDRSGILWTANVQYGVDKLNSLTSAFHTFPQIVRDGSSYHDGVTNNIAVSAGGYCWFTNNQGIYKWKPGGNKPAQIYKIKKTDIGLDAIMVSKDGRVYFGNGNGLQVLGPASHKLQSYTCKPGDTTSISSNKINYIFQDHTGIVWVGTEDKGICTFNPVSRKFKRYPYRSGNQPASSGRLDGATVNAIFEDKQGTIWVGINSGGLNRLDGKTGKFTSFFNDGHIHVGTISHILEDAEHRLWVGTYPDGLFEFDRKKGRYIRHLNEDDGLLFNTVTGITEDGNGFLWVSGARGLTRVDPKDLSVKTYPLKTILPGKSALYDYNLVQANGLMVMVLTDAITSFKLSDLYGNPYPPIVHIEKVSYSNPASTSDTVTSAFTYGKNKIVLPWNENKIAFNYIALHYAAPAQNKYAYWLEGYDKHWIQAGTQRSATYTNLAPGTYTFYVKASNSDGVWNNKGDSFTIIIDPPWWQRWWAWMLYVIVFIGAVYAFIAYRSRKLRRQNQLLEEKISLRTKQLSGANKELSEQQEEIITQRDRLSETLTDLKATQNQLIQSEKMASLGELTSGIAHEIQNPLNFVNNFSEVNKELIDELKEERKKEARDFANEDEILDNIAENEQKINLHGKRADSIVKGMLEHSRSRSGQKEPTDLNVMADEFMRLSYHGLRAKDKSFNAEMVTHFDPDLPKIAVVPQDIGRVFLNLFNNAFYAVNQKKKMAGADYKAEVLVSTSLENWQVIIKVKDNGIGIPDSIKDKIMQPFFTTKPTGEGTGLGLSLTYDMVVKGHGGGIKVNSIERGGSEFTISLPINKLTE